MNVFFTKMQGLGNDFVLLDARAKPFALESAQIVRLADRRYGVGCDQVLVLEPPALTGAAVRYRVFNADGSPAEHCGNGVRCVARYLAEHDGVTCRELQIEINSRRFELRLEADGIVAADMGAPQFAPAEVPLAVARAAPYYTLEFRGEQLRFGAVSMGNPHAVFEVADVAAAPVVDLGRFLQAHKLFPQRVNVGFMQVVDAAHIRLRVFERGVGETPACGTGACAAAAVGRLWGALADQVEVELAGGNLGIAWSGLAEDRLWMSGPAVKVFEGTIAL